MKSTAILLTAASFISLVASPVQAQESRAKKKPAAEKTTPAKKSEEKKEPAAGEEKELTKEQSVLKTALENHARLKGFHVDAVLKTGAGNATLSGALGAGSLSLECTEVTGAKKKRVVTGGVFYLSTDDGKTWKKDDAAYKQSTLLFNNIITAPMQMADSIVKEALTAKEEKLDGEDVLHIEKPAAGKSAAVHFWICREPKLDNMTFIRKAEITVAGDDLELLATITYSKLSEPVEIKAPEEK